jgi:DNA polymerase I
MRHGYCLVDANNIGFAAQMATKLTVGGRETQAIFGVIRTVRQIVAAHYHALDPILLWDGRSWRKDVFTEYKANRDDNPKMKLIRDGYRAQRADITRGLRCLGVPQLIAANMEADDLAGMLVRNKAHREGKKVLLISGDRDWLQLVGPRVSWHDPIRDVHITERNFTEVTGYATPRAFLEGKALQGDSGDNIPGVGGIGEKGAKELIAKHGSVAQFFAWFDVLVSDAELSKKFRDFGRNVTGGRDKFARNMQIMDLLPAAPPRPERLTLNRQPLCEEAFKDFCAELAFHSILKDFEDWIAPFRMLHEAREAA